MVALRQGPCLHITRRGRGWRSLVPFCDMIHGTHHLPGHQAPLAPQTPQQQGSQASRLETCSAASAQCHLVHFKHGAVKESQTESPASALETCRPQSQVCAARTPRHVGPAQTMSESSQVETSRAVWKVSCSGEWAGQAPSERPRCCAASSDPVGRRGRDRGTPPTVPEALVFQRAGWPYAPP